MLKNGKKCNEMVLNAKNAMKYDNESWDMLRNSKDCQGILKTCHLKDAIQFSF